MDQRLALYQPRHRVAGARTKLPAQKIPPGGWQIALSHQVEIFAIISQQRTKDRTAQTVCLLQYSVEYRSEVAGRRVDDLQYLGGRGFSIQRPVAFCGTFGKLLLEIGNDLLRIS